MGNVTLSGKQDHSFLQALDRRAKSILKARPAYKEMVDFYMTIFHRQIEWRDRLVVKPGEVPELDARQLLRDGKALAEVNDPGIEANSLLELWTEMKGLFRRGNDVLRQAVDTIEEAEKSDGFVAATWLGEQRPGRQELVTDACKRIGVDESVLATLGRAVTLPHWELVARKWLPIGPLEEWKRAHCPVCSSSPALSVVTKEQAGPEGDLSATRRYLYCPFCSSRWVFPNLKCPSCGSTKPRDAKYLFTDNEPELRVDFCDGCHCYIKVIDGGKMSGPIHVGLELLTAAHLDALAQDKNLSPLEVCR